jgi:hypothetical protein
MNRTQKFGPSPEKSAYRHVGIARFREDRSIIRLSGVQLGAASQTLLLRGEWTLTSQNWFGE